MRSHRRSANGRHGRSQPEPAGSERRAADDAAVEPPPPADPLAPFLEHFAVFEEFFSYYLATRCDLWRSRVRTFLFYGVLTAVAAIMASAGLVTATVLLFCGTAAALTDACGTRAWVGNVVVGGAVASVFLGGGYYWARRRSAAERRHLIEKYERRKQNERAELGTDVAECAAETDD